MKHTVHTFKWHDIASQEVFQKLVGFPGVQKSAMEVSEIIRCARLKNGERILDVCCGTGRHAIELAKRGYKVTAIDVAESYLKQARSCMRRVGVYVNFKKQHASKITGKNIYDLVLSYDNTLGLFTQKELSAQLKRIYQALKPGGALFLKTAGPQKPISEGTKVKLNNLGNCLVLEQQTIANGFRYEVCLVCDFKEKTIREFREKQKIFGRKNIRHYLKMVGFRICKSSKYSNKIKATGPIKRIFICKKPD